MAIFNNSIRQISERLKRPVKPTKAYNLWAENYENEVDNLIFELEKKILEKLFVDIDIKDKAVLDYGCGTGRNWPDILSKNPSKIIGCDISSEMLLQLISKYPQAETYLIKEKNFPSIPYGTIDFILSTLVVAHIKNIKNLFGAWNNYLSAGGVIIISDLHPELLREGGKRTFMHENKNLEIKNFVHSIEDIIRICSELNLEVEEIFEEFITRELKEFYERNNALHIYDRFRNMPLIYGMRIRK